MREVSVSFEELLRVRDNEISGIVERIVENRNSDSFDQELESELADILERTLEERILAWERKTGQTFDTNEMSFEEVINFDIPKEIAENLDSLAVERTDLDEWIRERDEDIWAKLEALDAPKNSVHDRMLSLDERTVSSSDFAPDVELEMDLVA